MKAERASFLADDADELVLRGALHARESTPRSPPRPACSRATRASWVSACSSIVRARLDAPRDAVEQQHEAGDALDRARQTSPAPRTGASCTHEAARRRRRHEALATGARSPFWTRPRRLQRVDDEVAVEDREDLERLALHERARLARGVGAVERLAQELHRARCTGRMPALLDVAHDHALRELGHERREAASLLLDPVVGLGHLALDVRLSAAFASARPLIARAIVRTSAAPPGAARCCGLATWMMRASSARCSAT
ncbi:MAG: hypothetical protein U1F54_15525 [Burkholderiales bacterium]